MRDVRALKRRLSQLPGSHPRFRQRLLLNGRQLEDATELDSPTDLQLVLLPFANSVGILERFLFPPLRVKRIMFRNLVQRVSRNIRGQGFANRCGRVRSCRTTGLHGRGADLLDLLGRLSPKSSEREPTMPQPGKPPFLIICSVCKDYIAGGPKLSVHTSDPRLQVEAMLQLPLDPNLFDARGFAALVQASQHGHVEVVALLLEGGANTDLAETFELSEGLTALAAASELGSVEVARLLLEAGADKDLADNNGAAPLMVASENGSLEVVRLLLEAGASIDLADKCGDTALMWASEFGHVEVARLLIEAGADKNLANNNGLTALLKLGCPVVPLFPFW